MQPVDYHIREAILNTEGNIIISASAGTGKTYQTVSKIKNDLDKEKKYCSFAAITFTRKAAKELAQRLGQIQSHGFVGTNDNFVMLEIIQPFMHDIYGSQFKQKIKLDFSNSNLIETFDEGISMLEKNLTIYKYSDVRKNFSFQLALHILENSKAARRYFKSKYFCVYIDEYQDSDIDMHKLFMFICKVMEIRVFLVGDTKQSIYGWRGGYSEGFTNLLSDPNFNSFTLNHNFRSNLAIQNYSNIFIDEVRGNCRKNSEFKNEVILMKSNTESEQADFIIKWVDKKANCSFLLRSNEMAEKWSRTLSGKGLDFVYIPPSPLDFSDNESEHIWISKVIANYIMQDRYSEYDVMNEIPLPESYNFSTIKKTLTSIKSSQKNKDAFVISCSDLYLYLGYIQDDKTIKEIDLLFDVVNNGKYIPTYNTHRYNHITSTVHSSKGLEYDQVIMMANDYSLTNQSDMFLHYVAVSRPKTNLLVLLGQDFRSKNYLNLLDEAVKKTKILGINIEKESLIDFVEVV